MPSNRKHLLTLWSTFTVLSLLACNALSGNANLNNSEEANDNANSDSNSDSISLTDFWEGVDQGSDDDNGFGSGDSDPTESSSPDDDSTATLVPSGSGGSTGEATPQPTTQISVDEQGVIKLFFDRAATPTSKDARSGPDVEAVFLSSPPVIDGDPSDWTANTYAMENIVFGEGFYADKSDLSGVFQIGWDNDALYIGAVIRDTRFVQTATESELYRGDGLEILIDTDLSGDFYSDELSSDDYQIGFSPGNLIQSSDPEAYIWYPGSQAGTALQINVAGQQTADGYAMEVKIPWSVLGISPNANQRYGFVLSVNDNDSVGDVQQQSVVSFGYQRTLFDPTGWYNLLLLSD